MQRQTLYSSKPLGLAAPDSGCLPQPDQGVSMCPAVFNRSAILICSAVLDYPVL